MASKTTHFATSREAKEFLVSKIVEQAQFDHVPLSEIEKKELYFSETGWTLPDMAEVDAAFNREYNQAEYERKIKKLVRAARKRAGRENPEEQRAWSDAIRRLRKEDHYLSVMTGSAAAPRHPLIDLLRATGTGVAVSAIAAVSWMFLKWRFPILRTSEGAFFVFWCITAGFVGLHLLLWLFLGRERANQVVDAILLPPFMLLGRVLEWGGLIEK